jgi:hypothetical protein
MLAATLIIPFVRTLFRFGPLHADDLALTVGAGVVVLVVLEVIKSLWRRAVDRQRSRAGLASKAAAHAQLAERTS